MKINKIELPMNRNNNNNIKQSKGVYLLFDLSLNLIYIGKTTALRTRLWQHTSENNNSTFEKIGEVHRCTSVIPRGIVHYYAFIEGDDDFENNLTELILIKLLNPPFNSKNNTTLPDYIQSMSSKTHINDKEI